MAEPIISRRRQQTALGDRMRLVRLLRNRGGWRKRPFHARDWPHRRFVEEHGLYRLLGTIRYPGVVHAT
jgi:hypothetical protein